MPQTLLQILVRHHVLPGFLIFSGAVTGALSPILPGLAQSSPTPAAPLSAPAAPADSGLFNSAIDRLPAATRASLRSGNAVVSGDQGRYVARVLVSASRETAWKVLTDYGNFAKFLPNLVSSKILESQGNQKVVEQIDSRQIFLFTITSRVKLAITESDRQKVEFRQVDGDLQSISGYWQIESIAPYAGATPNQVLITQVVDAQPKSGTPRDTFYDLFKGSLTQTMIAVRREVTQRQGNDKPL